MPAAYEQQTMIPDGSRHLLAIYSLSQDCVIICVWFDWGLVEIFGCGLVGRIQHKIRNPSSPPASEFLHKKLRLQCSLPPLVMLIWYILANKILVYAILSKVLWGHCVHTIHLQPCSGGSVAGTAALLPSETEFETWEDSLQPLLLIRTWTRDVLSHYFAATMYWC